MSCFFRKALAHCSLLVLQAAAAATQQSVSLFYAAPSMQAAAYVSDWDTWRANGVRSQPHQSLIQTLPYSHG